MIRIAYIAATLTVMTCAAPAFAQDATHGTQQAPAVVNANSSGSPDSGMGTDLSGQTATGAPAGLTRHEVEQQLYQAERDGQLSNLNQTTYKGGS
jgi:hypothetical protein